ncbi:MAG: patatin-like phospholipase family protein [Patescibacteria group bacterium]
MNNEIISNLKKRKEERLKGVDNSKTKTCLVVQGGGMRASYSMGCLQALEELGFNEAFDCVIGSSAGAINGAYFLAKQSKVATEVYSDHITNHNFINIFRIKKIMDVNYLIKILSEGKTSLNIKNIIDSRTDLRFSMIHFPSAKEYSISIKDNPNEIMNLIKASATIPALSNEKILIGNEKYIDGAVVNPIPLKSAIELGYTDIVVILTRSRLFKRKPSKLLYDFLSLSYFKDWPKESRDDLFKRFSQVNDLYNFIWSHEGDNKSYRILIVAPEKDSLAGVISISKKRVLENIKRGYNDIFKIFNK